MKTVRPKPLSAPVTALRLTPEEGFVLSRIDGRLSVGDLVALTGIDETRVEQIVTKLATEGAVQLDGGESSPDVTAQPTEADEGTASLADFAAALGMDPSSFGVPVAVEAPVEAPRVASNIPTLDPDLDAAPAPDPEPLAQDADAPSAEAEADAVADAADADAAEASVEADERNYREIYATKFHALPVDARVATAKIASGSDLLALCLDGDARVIAAILENPTVGLDHVRLMAFHHRTGTGLEMISRRQDWLRDLLVERRLFRNPQTPETVLARLMASKQLLQTFKLLVDREVPELTRTRVRGHLRKKWQTAPPEDRADLLLRTEGRCLIHMTGCTFDARTTQILCGKTINSMIFIQNLAKFGATPPGVLAHLMKQPFVRKNQAAKKLLLQHPNLPGEAKRGL